MLTCKQMYSLVFATKPKIEQIKKKSLEKSASNIQTFVPIICIFTSGINFPNLFPDDIHYFLPWNNLYSTWK